MTSPAQHGIVGYITTNGPPRQRERIEAALAEAGVAPVEIVEEYPRQPSEGREGLARVLEHARRSDVGTIIVASFDALFPSRGAVESWRRDVQAKYGVKVLELE